MKVTAVTPPGTVGCVCSWHPRLWMKKLSCPGEAEVPLPLHFGRPHHLHASLCRAGPRFLRRQWSKMERQSQLAVLYKKGAMDSGISETNLTLVFRLFQTIKIKAGLRRPLSSESCYVSSFGKAKAGGREKGFPIIGWRHRVVNASTLKLTVQCFWHFINSFFSKKRIKQEQSLYLLIWNKINSSGYKLLLVTITKNNNIIPTFHTHLESVIIF